MQAYAGVRVHRPVARTLRALAITSHMTLLVGLPGDSAVAGEQHAPRLEVAHVKRLSTRGSTRASFYPQSNKIVTLDAKTHVAWLDSVAETMIATYDHAAGKWSRPTKVGTGYDNHGGPALTCDSRGYLHIVFGPHHGPLQHCRSMRPNDASEWEKLPDFGINATYPSLVADDKDILHIIYRGSRRGTRMLLYQQCPDGGSWSEPLSLARAPIESGYTHFHSELAIARDGTLHVVFDIFFENTAKCAGHLMSAGGVTWKLANGSIPELPVQPDSNAFFKRADTSLRTWNVVCDSKGRPWINITGPQGLELYHYDGKRWRTIHPLSRIAPASPGVQLAGYMPMTVDSDDRIYIGGALADSGDVGVLYSHDGGETFHCLHVYPKDDKLPHRGVNFERCTGHHRVGTPWLLFSTGLRGTDNFGKDVSNRVHAIQLSFGSSETMP